MFSGGRKEATGEREQSHAGRGTGETEDGSRTRESRNAGSQTHSYHYQYIDMFKLENHKYE